MKGVWLLSVLAIGLVGGHALAGPYTLDVYTAAQLRDIRYSDPDGSLDWVGYNDGTPLGTPQVGIWVYGSDPQYGQSMRFGVGFVGTLSEDLLDGDSYASIALGTANSPSTLAAIRQAGTFNGFSLPVANDNDDPWAVRLYVETGGTSYLSGFTTLTSGASSTLVLDFGTTIDFAQVTDLGFEIRGQFAPGGNPSNPDVFHISVAPVPIVPVPVPGAFALTLFGVGCALRLRRRL